MYNIFHVDAPWTYRNKKTGGSMISGSAAKYQTMTLEEICDLPVPEISERDSVLFLWGTTPLKWEPLIVMAAWGFTYKTTIYWRKIMSLGMGFWFRGQVEELLVGVRGKVKAFRLQEPNFIQTKALAHSEKPPEFRALIERATDKMPNPTRLEMFARKRAPGWDVFGNEVEGSIVLPPTHSRPWPSIKDLGKIITGGEYGLAACRSIPPLYRKKRRPVEQYRLGGEDGIIRTIQEAGMRWMDQRTSE